MVALNDAVVPGERSALTGITLKIISVTIFVGMSTCIKAAGTVPAGQIVFFRSFFAILPILAVLYYRRELRTAFHTAHPFGHLFRALVGVFSMGLSFYGLTRLPLPEAITLNYAQPLIVVVLSALFIGEVVRIYRWSAVLAGLVGVLIVAWPELTLLSGNGSMDASESSGVIAILVSAFFSAIAMLLVRRLVYTERNATIVLYFSCTASLIALCSLPFGWDSLTRAQTFALIGAGICGGVGQMLMTACYRHADLSTIAPFEYTSMILSIIVGYFVFGDLPTAYTLTGGVIIVGAGLFIIWRERQIGLRRPAARRFVRPEG